MLKPWFGRHRVLIVWGHTELDMTRVLYGRALSINFLPLRAATDLRHTYQGKVEGITFYPKGEGAVFFLPRWTFNCFEVLRILFAGEHTYTVSAPSIDQVKPCVNANKFHAVYGHANEGMLRETATGMGMTLNGELGPWHGCSQAKSFRKASPSSTDVR